MANVTHIRNFCIIAHIDHGKSTLADRLIEYTQTVAQRDMKAQLLDSMDLERERGITIKMQAIRLEYVSKGQVYILNLIDTPGHVDFSYEVSRSLAACEGALLLVDAAQGIEAQTLANFYLALEQDLEIIPVINKVDLPNAEPDQVAADIEQVLGIPGEDCVRASAKEGIGIEDILEAVVHRMPGPKPGADDQLRALIYDAHYDPYRGVISYLRLMSGTITPGQRVLLMASDSQYDVLEVGCFSPQMQKRESLSEGEVGYMISSIKNVQDASVGDTVTDAKRPVSDPLAGYAEAKPMIFSGMYPVDTDQYKDLQEALDKLKLNDASLTFETESSQALGFGFRVGFLGLLHMEIISERIEREFNIDIVTTAPNVTYRYTNTQGVEKILERPSDFPDPTHVTSMQEPVMGLAIITPTTYIGPVMELVKQCRGALTKSEMIDSLRQQLTFRIPLNEFISHFFDSLKSSTKGYASMDYWFESYDESSLVKVNMMINGDTVDALSFICHRSKAETIARKMSQKLKELIPRQLYEVAIQAAIGGKIICRESIKAMRKNVTAKCYGGDISRKRKLLEKQKAGKKRMKQIGSIQVPKEAFLSVLKLDL